MIFPGPCIDRIGVAVGFGFGVALGVGVNVCVGVGDGVKVCVAVGVMVGVGVGVAKSAMIPGAVQPDNKKRTITAAKIRFMECLS